MWILYHQASRVARKHCFMCAFELPSGEWFQSIPMTLRTVTDTSTCPPPPQKVRNLCLSTDLRQSGSISPAVLLFRGSPHAACPTTHRPPPYIPHLRWCACVPSHFSHALLQGILLTQRSNLGLLHCRQILYC